MSIASVALLAWVLSMAPGRPLVLADGGAAAKVAREDSPGEASRDGEPRMGEGRTGERRTVDDLVSRAGEWLVAIEVERGGDLPPPNSQMVKALPPEMQSYYRRPKGWVSGVLVSAEGHVVTSWYNVAGEVQSIRVMLPSGELFPAKLVAKSLPDDIALLRLEGPVEERQGPVLTAAHPIVAQFREPLWADSSKLRPGQVVLAVGRSPDPGSLTVTRGILSAVRRNGKRAVQTDAELNYGNAGGVLLDLDGRIVAIPTFVGHTNPQWGVNSGVGLATTAESLLSILPHLQRGEDFVLEVPFLGVQDDPEFTDDAGAKVRFVAPGSPAAKAGLQAGDVITGFDGKAVDGFYQLRHLIFSRKVGDKVNLKVRRGGDEREIEAVLGEAPSR